MRKKLRKRGGVGAQRPPKGSRAALKGKQRMPNGSEKVPKATPEAKRLGSNEIAKGRHPEAKHLGKPPETYILRPSVSGAAKSQQTNLGTRSWLDTRNPKEKKRDDPLSTLGHPGNIGRQCLSSS